MSLGKKIIVDHYFFKWKGKVVCFLLPQNIHIAYRNRQTEKRRLRSEFRIKK